MVKLQLYGARLRYQATHDLANLSINVVDLFQFAEGNRSKKVGFQHDEVKLQLYGAKKLLGYA